MTSVLAHGGELTGPHDLVSAWSWDPLVLTSIVAVCWWYAKGVRSLWRVGGRGDLVPVGRVAAFGLAILTIVVALVSPVDAASDVLFSVHMTQHVLVTLVAAPLFVLGVPLQVMAWGLPPRARRATGRWQGRLRRVLWQPTLPGAGLAAFVVVFTLWHVPALYDAAIASEAVHALEHATMLTAALAFWAPVVRPRRSNPGLAVVLLFVAMIAGGLLSALLVFAPTPWYAHDATREWGLTRLQDQQAAGAVMWVFGGGVYIVSGAIAVLRWLRLDDAAARRRDRAASSVSPAG